MTEKNSGVRFSFNYINYPELLEDSERMRRRLGAHIYSIFSFWMGIKSVDLRPLRDIIEYRMGISLPTYKASERSYWVEQVCKLGLGDVLDLITIVHDDICFKEKNNYIRVGAREAFLEGVSRIFEEERVRYRVDKLGGVHFSVDAAFEQVRVSAIRALSTDRYDSVLQYLNQSYKSLDCVPLDTKGSIRSIFYANEILFKYIFPRAIRLGSSEVEKNLRPIVNKKYSGLKPDNKVAQSQVSQYKEWVEGAHNYRHEQGEGSQPDAPVEIAVHYVSSGAAWLRWLQQFDLVD
ncbi:hypothetical protein HMH01_11900 [Halovulum dunhuangense]|uniref:Uncharacterized protein n=1 Tax=Halovulum dunhuangense TaxID=1505036 RepID=A0A849L3Z9_9RHOB|nr:hypothetical protein [Halovulum dunhuangense]NNU81138.1 hypothetical protein [Halovulum dunhuangense]